MREGSPTFYEAEGLGLRAQGQGLGEGRKCTDNSIPSMQCTLLQFVVTTLTLNAPSHTHPLYTLHPLTQTTPPPQPTVLPRTGLDTKISVVNYLTMNTDAIPNDSAAIAGRNIGFTVNPS